MMRLIGSGKWVLSLAAAAVFAASAAGAREIDKQVDRRIAALALPAPPSADWQQWDSFLTNVVKTLSEEFRPELRDALGEFFLDARHRLVDSLRAGSADPVVQLFTDSWDRLSPLVKEAVSGATPETASRYAAFIAAMDAASSAAGLGQALGLFRITPEFLSGAANVLGAGGADPLAYDLVVDSALRALIGFTNPLPGFQPSPRLEQSRLRPLLDKASAGARLLGARAAYAAEVDLDRLNQWVPEADEVPSYLMEVRQLLHETSDKVLSNSKLAPQHRQVYRHTVFATGWQESCWRQYIKKGEKLAPLASSTGDVGLMQVNRITWRGIYDVKGLNGSISYNGNAGAEILHYYLTRYAIAKKEDKQKGGHLARATYSAYNAGPSGLARYRGVRQTPALKKVDDAFWSKFQTVASGKELAVKDCYTK
ncbi:MAG TPA: transglycosylase SLT domain-containing protein [Candidatus Binatia bacterium]|nr:transglycosylase SLT domain-containing protein [Candidatus Binatia bacterium]